MTDKWTLHESDKPGRFYITMPDPRDKEFAVTLATIWEDAPDSEVLAKRIMELEKEHGGKDD